MKLIDKKTSLKTILDKIIKTFMICINCITAKMTIYLLNETQI